MPWRKLGTQFLVLFVPPSSKKTVIRYNCIKQIAFWLKKNLFQTPHGQTTKKTNEKDTFTLVALVSPPKNFRISGPQNAQNQTTKGFSYSRQLRISVGRRMLAKPASFQVYISFPPWVCWIKCGATHRNPPTPNESFKPLSGTVRKGAVRESSVVSLASKSILWPILFWEFLLEAIWTGERSWDVFSADTGGGKNLYDYWKKCNGSFEKTRQGNQDWRRFWWEIHRMVSG